MRAFLLLAVLALLALSFTSTASAQYTVCQNYSGQANSNSTTQIALLTAIVVRAANGGNFTSPQGVNYTIPGLFNANGPLYAIFSGQQQYRVGAPNYITNSTALGVLATKLVAYFGALFGCTATGYPAVQQYDQYAVHANMSINYTQESYFNGQLAATLLSFGVDPLVVANVAAPALGLFNRCGGPYAPLNSTARLQVCGTADCPLATGANYSTCVAYFGYPALTSSSSSTGGSVPSGSTYPSGSVAVPLTVQFTTLPTAAAGAAAVASDIALNIASEANATAPNGNYTQSNILPYVVVYQFGNTIFGPASRRLLQTNTTSVPVRFIILGNITNLGLPASTASSNLVTAIAAGSLVTPALTANGGGTIPRQTVTPATPGQLPTSSSTGIYYSSTGNGAAGKYAAGGLFVAAAAIVASLLL